MLDLTLWLKMDAGPVCLFLSVGHSSITQDRSWMRRHFLPAGLA